MNRTGIGTRSHESLVSSVLSVRLVRGDNQKMAIYFVNFFIFQFRFFFLNQGKLMKMNVNKSPPHKNIIDLFIIEINMMDPLVFFTHYSGR